MKPYVRTPEIIAKMVAGLKGRRLSPSTEFTREKMLGNQINKGRKPSEKQRQIARQTMKGNKHNFKDGLQNHKYAAMHQNMMARCYRSTHPKFKNYGGAKPSVEVFKPWHCRAVFIDFLEGCMAPKPSGKTLDRINPWEGYFPWNIRWATPSEQRLNQRRNVPFYLTYG